MFMLNHISLFPHHFLTLKFDLLPVWVWKVRKGEGQENLEDNAGYKWSESTDRMIDLQNNKRPDEQEEHKNKK